MQHRAYFWPQQKIRLGHIAMLCFSSDLLSRQVLPKEIMVTTTKMSMMTMKMDETLSSERKSSRLKKWKLSKKRSDISIACDVLPVAMFYIYNMQSGVNQRPTIAMGTPPPPPSLLPSFLPSRCSECSERPAHRRPQSQYTNYLFWTIRNVWPENILNYEPSTNSLWPLPLQNENPQCNFSPAYIAGWTPPPLPCTEVIFKYICLAFPITFTGHDFIYYLLKGDLQCFLHDAHLTIGAFFMQEIQNNSCSFLESRVTNYLIWPQAPIHHLLDW